MSTAAIQITDPSLKQAILAHFIDQIDHGGMDKLLAAGVHPSFIDEIRTRPTRDLGYAARHAEVRIEASIDAGRIMGCFMRIDDSRKAETLKEYFINHGASANLLREMFHVSKAEVFSLRQVLNSKSKGHGRTKLPPESIRDAIYSTWSSIKSEFVNEQAREQLYRLHQQFKAYNLSQLWASIDEYNKLAT